MSISIRDTFVVVLSDTHSAGTTALFPNKFWQFENGNHTPTKDQKEMYEHWVKCAAIALEKRKGKRLVIVLLGDAIDGVHHSTLQIVTRLKKEQKEIHVDLMDTFMKICKFSKKKGDKLYYVKGTEIHTNSNENEIGEDLGAEKNGELYAFDMLPLNINGFITWFAHHGASAGKGANKGNAVRNFAKNIYYDCQADKVAPPDMVITAHVHVPAYETFNCIEDGKIATVHGAIVPSWQYKTRFGYRVAPVERNKVGMFYYGVGADGTIRNPDYETMMIGEAPVTV